MNRKGFTLIELLIVVVIIGILAAIAIPKFANTKAKAYVASMKSDLRNVVTAQEGFFADSVRYADGVTVTNNGACAATKLSFCPTIVNTVQVVAPSPGGASYATATNRILHTPVGTGSVSVNFAEDPHGIVVS